MFVDHDARPYPPLLSADPLAPGSIPGGPDLVLREYRVRFDGRDSRRSSLWRCDPHPRCVFHQGTALGGDDD
ncbi:hypothetical protein [Microbacterium sp. Bi128]|uniref:hypothetical protein n=1 Tax=Microbacterium sp. Bi128 TaxID=2821115 RepID=UPI001E2C0C5A|nr:hypothetical protein [Microbacterium sp. Bi128]